MVYQTAASHNVIVKRWLLLVMVVMSRGGMMIRIALIA